MKSALVYGIPFLVAGALLALPAAGGETILRDPVLRAVSPGWADLGRPDFPFKAIYVNQMGNLHYLASDASANAITADNANITADQDL